MTTLTLTRFIDGFSSPRVSLPRSWQWTLQGRVGGGYRPTNPALRGIPTGQGVNQLTPDILWAER